MVMIRIGTWFTSGTPIWNRRHQKIGRSDWSNSSSNGQRNKFGNLDENSKTKIGRSGASGSVINSISIAISGAIKKFTDVFQSTFKLWMFDAVVDGELSQIKGTYLCIMADC